MSALGFDGYEYAGAYHWMINQAQDGKFVMVMPDLRNHDGEPTVYAQPFTMGLAPLISPHRKLREVGFVGFAVVSHKIAREHLAAKQD